MVFAMLIAFAATQSQAGQTPRQRAPQSTGVLATAGGVVFAGALGGSQHMTMRPGRPCGGRG